MGICCYQNFNENKNEFYPTENKIITNKQNNENNNTICYCLSKECIEKITSFIFDIDKNSKPYAKLKKQILKRQKQIRFRKKELGKNKISQKIFVVVDEEEEKKEKNKQINQLLEDMCIYGKIMKEQIKEDKENIPYNFLEIEEALDLELEDKSLFILGLFAKSLKEYGVNVEIEKSEIFNEEEENECITCIQFIINAIYYKKKYELFFKFENEKKEQLLTNGKKIEEFKENLRKKLSNYLNIDEDKIIIVNPFSEKDGILLQIIFKNGNLNNNLDKAKFKSILNNDQELSKNLVDIDTNMIIEGCKLNKEFLDLNIDSPQKLNENGDINHKWKEIKFKIDNFNDVNDPAPGINYIEEGWCNAYLWIGDNSNLIKCFPREENEDINGNNKINLNSEDKNNEGKNSLEGIFCTEKINIAEKNSKNLEINNKSYKIMLIVKVKKDAIQKCNCANHINYWVVNGTYDEIKPDKIIYKELIKESRSNNMTDE